MNGYIKSRQNQKYTINLVGDGILIFIICFVIFGLFLRNATFNAKIISDSMAEAISTGIKAITGGLLVLSVPTLIRRMDKTGVSLLFVVAVVYVVQKILFRSNNLYFNDTAETFFITILPVMVCLLEIEDFELLVEKMLTTSKIIALLNILVIFSFMGRGFKSNYSMGYSQALAFPTNALLFMQTQKERTKKDRWLCRALCVSNIFAILVYGSRGSLVSILVFYVVLNLFFYDKKSTKNELAYKIIFVVIMLVCAVFYEQILNFVLRIIHNLGFTSRTLSSFTSEEVSDSGRSEIWEKTWNDVLNSPLRIRGICADMVLNDGAYSHNIFLEMVHSFGLLFGGLFDIVIAVQIIKSLLNKDSKVFMLKIFALMAFFPVCLWSGHIWTSMYFWMWVVLLIKEKQIIVEAPPDTDVDSEG